MLTALNFKAIAAPDGAAALIQAAENQKSLRAVITDMHMPGMDGLTFVRVPKQMLPEAKIIVTSGRLEEPEATEFNALRVNAMVTKLFTQENLVEKLQTIFATQTPAEINEAQSPVEV